MALRSGSSPFPEVLLFCGSGYAALVVARDRGSDLVCLDLCKGFDAVPHDLLASASEIHGLDGWSTAWLKVMSCSVSFQHVVVLGNFGRKPLNGVRLGKRFK